MARLLRLCPVGIPQHIIQRGNNRQICFAHEQDFAVYANWLEEYALAFGVELHAWVFMTNHVHLLATPRKARAISDMMQALGRRYVRYFNRKYQRTGTLWEGRFKSCLVQSEHYLLQCQLYIELNPVRANMVDDPGKYAWSSYRAHAVGQAVSLHTPHLEYLRLSKTPVIRHKHYRELFVTQLDVQLTQPIRDAVSKGLALGSDQFKNDIEKLSGSRVRPAKMGRPSKKSSSLESLI
ncbi:MAG: transposase [Pseudomonadales bacterium]